MKSNKSGPLTLKEFNAIFDRLYHRLCFFAYKYVDDFEDCKDIVQELFLVIWENKVDFNDKDKVDWYLYVAVKRRCIDSLKSSDHKNMKLCTPQELENLQTDYDIIKEVIAIEASVLVENVLQSLPNRCAEVIRLSLEKNTREQIAKKMGISINTVKDYKKVAYEKFREILGPQRDDLNFFLIIYPLLFLFFTSLLYKAIINF